MIPWPQPTRSQRTGNRYPAARVTDNRAQFALRWQDHEREPCISPDNRVVKAFGDHSQTIARPWRWMLELLLILATVAVVAGLYYVAKTEAAKFNPTPTHTHEAK